MNETGESKMTQDTGFSTSDAVLWGAMNNMGRGGYGGGYGGGGGAWGSGHGHGGYGGWGAPNVNAARSNRNLHAIDRNSVEQHRDEDCTRMLNSQGQHTIMDKLNSQNANGDRFEILTNSFQSELRIGDRLRDIDDKMAENAAAIAKCCCDLALESAKAETRNVERFCELKSGQAAIDAKIDANQKFMELFAENQSLKTQVACGCTTGCSHRCHDHHGRR